MHKRVHTHSQKQPENNEMLSAENSKSISSTNLLLTLKSGTSICLLDIFTKKLQPRFHMAKTSSWLPGRGERDLGVH